MANQSKQDIALLPVYLISGEDTLKRQTVMRRLKERLSTLGDLSFNSEQLDAERATGSSIVAACNTVPFASPVRLVEVTHAEKLKKSDIDQLLVYLKKPCESTVLALVAQKMAKNARVTKAVLGFGKTALIDCTPLKRYELPKAIRKMAAASGLALSDKGARKLVELIGEDTVHLYAEIKKLTLARSGTRPLDDEDIARMVSRSAEVKPWDFVDAFAARDMKKCMQYLRCMDSVSPYALLAMCITRLRELVCARSLLQRNKTDQLPSQLKMPAWRCKNHLSYARNFSDSELRQALIKARNTERAMKSGTNPADAFLEWVLSINS